MEMIKSLDSSRHDHGKRVNEGSKHVPPRPPGFPPWQMPSVSSPPSYILNI